MKVEVDRLHKLSSNVYIVKVTGGNAVCWSGDTMIDEGEVVLGVSHSNNNTRLVHPSSISVLESRLKIPVDAKNLTVVSNEEGVICDVGCSECGQSIEDDEEVILLSGVFMGNIDPWIHMDCRDDFIDTLTESIEEYHPEIVSGTI